MRMESPPARHPKLSCRDVHRIRRAIFAIMLWLAFGAIVTVAIAWSIAAWVPLRPTVSLGGTLGSTSNGATFGSAHRGFGWLRRSWNVEFFGSDRFPPFMICTEKGPQRQMVLRDELIDGFANWGRFASPEIAQASTRSDGCEHATGWPFVALWYEFAVEPASRTTARARVVRGGYSLGAAPSGPIGVDRWHALPYRPIWYGLLLDSLIWGLCIWLIAVGARTLRRLLRLRRNHCPRCNYDLSASPTTCPECGWNRPAPTAITPQSAQLADPPS